MSNTVLMRAALATAALTCAAGQASAQTSRLRDSAGVSIVENSARAAAPVAFRLGAQRLQLGGPRDDPDEELNPRQLGSAGGLRLSDGTLALVNGVRILYYDASGRRTGMLGRRGAGPEEFQSLAAVEFCRTRGDTIVAADYRNGRFAVIHANRVLRTTPFMDLGGATPGCFDDGTVLRMGGLPNFKTPTYTIRLNRVRLDGTPVTNLGEIVMTSPSAITLYLHPTIAASGQRYYVGDVGRNDIRVYSASGRLIHIIRTADPLQRITDADVEKAINRQRSELTRESTRKSWRPEFFPPYSMFRVDPKGILWVMERPAEGVDVQRWTAFDVNGRIIGGLDVPRKIGALRTFMVSFGAEEVQVGGLDDDGFVYITWYALDRVAR